jgi:hypothetical protein
MLREQADDCRTGSGSSTVAQLRHHPSHISDAARLISNRPREVITVDKTSTVEDDSNEKATTTGSDESNDDSSGDDCSGDDYSQDDSSDDGAESGGDDDEDALVPG